MSQLNEAHHSALRLAARTRAMAHLAAGICVVTLVAGRLNNLAIAAWSVLLLIGLWFGHQLDAPAIETAHEPRQPGPNGSHCSASIANGVLWAAPLAGSALFLDAAVQIRVWTVQALLMTANAVLVPALPLATLLFSGLVGGSAIGLFLFAGLADMAAVATLSLLVVTIGTMLSTRRDMSGRTAAAGIVEKEKKVSLLLREFAQGDGDWLWQSDASGRVRALSQRFAHALGCDPSEAEGAILVDLLTDPEKDADDLSPGLRDLDGHIARHEHFSSLQIPVRVRGERRWWELSGAPCYDDNGNFDGFHGVGSDVTKSRESAEKIAWLARYDVLTNLPNRMMLTEELEEVLEAAQNRDGSCAFLMIDLDRFKAINDTLGHAVGDRLLALVSQRLETAIDRRDLCGRLGGDEFAILVRDVPDPEHVPRIAENVIQQLSQPYLVDNHTLFVGASVGSAIGPHDGTTVETLMRNADLALHRAKDIGGNAHFRYDPALHAHAEERRKLEFALRRALERNEFHLQFQPVVDAHSGGIVSFEALLRWESIEHGPVAPATFIPLAEDTRLVVPIGEWVLREACREATRWPEHIRVAVNVSGEQLLDTNFAACVTSALRASGLPASRLELEVTESIFLRDPALARTALDEVMALGCSVALDDFGTGYSSLGYLRNLRFSTIKIDRSFVRGVATGNPESLAIIRAVVAMADSLGMKTTAEGAETSHEVDVIRELGCRKIQGFFFGHPMSAQAAAALLDRQSQGPSSIVA